MKCKIKITGQIGSIYSLLSALNNGTAVNGMFNSKHIYFDTVTEAKRAIREANRHLKNEHPGTANHRMSKDATSLSYDAASAVIDKD